MFINAAGRALPIHGILGITALAVMGIHSLWATSVWLKKNELAAYFVRLKILLDHIYIILYNIVNNKAYRSEW